MTEKNRIKTIIEHLEKLYPDVKCELNYIKPYELLFSTRLAAQCTDVRVNKVAEDLYKTFPSLESFAKADVEDIEKIIRPCGLFHTKANDLKLASIMLLDKFDGIVPDNMEDLLKLPGIGRKTANLILGDIYGKPAIVADTHCIRLSTKLGLVPITKDAHKVERVLKEKIPQDKQLAFCHRLVHHGRAVCTARSPKCAQCILFELCKTRG